jgi:hypothetical protein
MNTTQANTFFDGVNQSTVNRYTDYWHGVRPITADDFLRRYLFAFTSVHTTWESNVRGYNALKDLSWVNDKDGLLARLIKARCGMHNNRTEYIWKFKEQFYNNLDLFTKVQGDWTSYRNRLVKEISGLGIAKVSFTLEMCFPKEAMVSCIDTWGIKLYELPTESFQSRKGIEMYELAEKHWVDRSIDIDASPMVTRSIYWDKLKKRRNPRYWSYVLEN